MQRVQSSLLPFYTQKRKSRRQKPAPKKPNVMLYVGVGENLNIGVTEAVRGKRDVSNESNPNTEPQGLLPFFVAFSLIYLLFVAAAMRRGVWYDELFTLDIASASTPSRVMELIRKWDLNPPLSYFLTRWSMGIFGHGKLGLRLPSIIEFYTASAFLFAFLRKRLGNAFALFAVMILWEGPLFYYAVEARPYALLLMFFSILIFSWDRATASNRSSRALAGVFVGTLGMLLSHVFAPLSLAAIFLAEGVRFWRTRKADFALWAALVLPCLAILIYIPLFHIYRAVLFPFYDQASLRHIWTYFTDTLWDGAPVLYATMIAFAGSGDRMKAQPLPFPLEQLVAACSLLCVPVLLNLVLMHGHRAFWPRYCITTAVTIYLVYACLLACRAGVGQRGGYLAAGVLLFFGLLNVAHVMLRSKAPSDAAILATIRPDLPIVVENGLTFFEMNHFEESSLLDRVHYLKNRPASIKYSHSTLFDDFEPPERLDKEFHIHAHVDDYASFLARHPQFLMFTEGNGTYWLVSKLRDEGQQIEKMESVPAPYSDSEVYLVTVRKPPTDD
jgi:hypothetical protein